MQQSEIDTAIQSIYKTNCERGPNGGGGMFPVEYSMAADVIMETPGPVLVFGLGNDSWLWASLCEAKEKVICFVEDDPKWASLALENINKKLGHISKKVCFQPFQYCPKSYRKGLVDRFKSYGAGPICLPLLQSLGHWEWGVIIVDAPTGERIESLYTARLLALRARACSVLVHDYTRDKDSVDLAFDYHPISQRKRELVLLQHNVGDLPCLGWERKRCTKN